jgi:ParB family chromosome partitioning protein
MPFDIASVLQGATAKTEQEQIVYLPLDKLDPDPNNFYTLEDLENLAANIELIGLQQPIRVRPGKDGHYIVVSGHRRRAACMLIQDGEAESRHMFDNGVACIIDEDSCSDSMRELRLIYANSATRVMTPAEISRQAERVEMLLYQLKEEGVAFPGRMRDHVAKACAVSKSKLARLHAIRKNLAPDLVSSYFDKGQMAESVAYELSKHDQDTQRWIVDTYKATHPKSGIDNMQEWWAQGFAACASKMAKMHCREIAGGGDCIHQREHVEHIWRKGYEGYEGCVSSSAGREPKCCADCESLASCSASCPRCDRKKAKLKADLKAQRQSERETKKADEENRKLQHELDESQAALYWARLGGALKDAGIDFWTLQDSIDEDHYHTGKLNRVLCSWVLQTDDIEALLDGRQAENDDCEIPMPIWEHMDNDGLAFARTLCKMADLLGVSLDYLFLRTDNPAGMPVSEPDTGGNALEWKTGEPPRDGRYYCRILIGDAARPHEQRMEWKNGTWYVFGDPADKVEIKVVAWWPLPAEV